MKLRAALLVAGLVATACTQTTATITASFVGSNDVALVDRYLFITSTDRNELRVLDLAPPGAVGRRFVQAPNPLEALSVPVLDRPTMVKADAWYDVANGQRMAGAFVYASRPGAKEISVVDATRPTTKPAADLTYADVRFREIHRLQLPGPLTAMAASHDVDGHLARLYVATWDGTAAILWRYELPETAATVAAAAFSVTPTVVTRASDPLVAAVVLPALVAEPGNDVREARAARTAGGTAFCDAQECIALATRKSSGQAGQALLLEPSTQRAVALGFPGPVRALSTQGRFTLTPASGKAIDFAPGERVFAILDEEKCGSPDCGGVVAVDTRTATADGFAAAIDSTGNPMLPLQIGSGLFTGLVTVPGGVLLIPGDSDPTGVIASGTSGTKVFPLLGIAASSNGGLLFFDALQLRHIDLDLAPASVDSYSMTDATGAAQTWVDGPQVLNGDGTGAVVVADGAWRSQSIGVVWEGPVPGLQSLATSAADGKVLQVPADLQGRVLVGDIVGLGSADGPCGEATIATVGQGTAEFDQVPAGCDGRTLYSLRAGPAAPYVVTAVVLGYLGRGAPGGVLERHDPANYFARQPGYSPTAATLRLAFVPATPNVTRDTLWTLNVEGHYAPFVSLIDYTVTNCLQRMTVPGTPVYDQVRDLLFVTFPSANAVAEVKPGLAIRGAMSSTQGVLCHQ